MGTPSLSFWAFRRKMMLQHNSLIQQYQQKRWEKAPPCTPPLRGGGELEAAAAPEAAGHHCRTRRPRLPLVRHRPFGPGCGRSSYWQSGGPLASAASAEARAALPERPTQTGSGCPLGGALPRSQRRAGIKRQRCRPSQRPRRGHPFRVPTAPPVALAAPAPRPPPVRRAAAGRWFPLGRSLRPLPVAPGRSPAPAGALAPWPPAPLLHRLPAAGCAACAPCAPAPQRKGCCDRKRPRVRTGTGSGPAPGPNSAHNMASVIRNCKQLTCCLWQHSYNSCYAHNRAGRISGSSRARATSSSGKAAVRPPAERPSAAARCCRCPGRAGGRGWRHLRPAAAARCAAARAGQSRAAPSRSPPPPPTSHPAQAAAKPGLSAWLPCCCSAEKSPCR